MRHIVCNLHVLKRYDTVLYVSVQNYVGGQFRMVYSPFQKPKIKAAIRHQLQPLVSGGFRLLDSTLMKHSNSLYGKIVFDDPGDAALIYLMKKK